MTAYQDFAQSQGRTVASFLELVYNLPSTDCSCHGFCCDAVFRSSGYKIAISAPAVSHYAIKFNVR